jgi:UPF0755 protein
VPTNERDSELRRGGRDAAPGSARGGAERSAAEREAARAERERRRREGQQGGTGDAGGPPRAGERPAPRAERVRRTRRDPASPPVAAPPRERRRRGPRRARVLIFFAAVVVALAAIVVFGWLYYFHTGPEGGSVTVTIPAGSTLTGVADLLAAKRIVPRARAFEIRAESDGHAADLKPGTYTFHVNEPYETLIAQLVAGGKPLTVKVTIPEGFTIPQTAGLVHSRLSGFSAATYIDLTQKHPMSYVLTGYKKGNRLEGLLFPATYDVLPGVTPREFVQQQLDAFTKTLTNVDMTRAQKAKLTPYDVVIIASMIEREARVSQERALVSAVIWNRLRKGMKLQIDATIQYALGKQKPVLTYQDLKIDSPYNTYLHFGLPPTPIANPGAASLVAAANPANVDYLYYVARGDGSGKHYFSSTYSQFLQDQARAQH